MKRIRHTFLLALLLALAPAWAEPAANLPAVTPPTANGPYTGVWVDDSATLSDETLNSMVEAVASQQADPQHIVLLVHGLATPRAVSAQQYVVLSKDVLEQYGKFGQRTAVVGLQWNSDMGPGKSWIRKVIKATIGGGGDNPYLVKVALARNVGVTAGRQMLIKLNQRFPGASIDILAHSLGCDVTRNTFAWEAQEKLPKVKNAPEPTQPFAPAVAVKLNLVAMAGADIDYDLLYTSDAQIKKVGAPKMVWMTVGSVRNPDAQDYVLTARGFARGRAMGNTLPHMHRAQIDALCSNRRIIFDANDIPARHAYLSYYDDKRLARIADVAVALADPSKHSALLDTLDEIIKAPGDPKVLQKYFAKKDLAVSFYTIWRLENLLCGQTRHIEDGYLQRIALMLNDDPKAIARERRSSPCVIVRDGWWPTPAMVDEAISRLPGQEGRPQMQGFP